MGVKVRQKVKGKGKPWWVFISHNGKRTSRKIGDKRAAEAVARKIEAKLALGDFGFDDEKPIPTFREYAKTFMAGYSKVGHKPSTGESYQSALDNHILPVFGHMRLDEIHKKDIKKFITDKQKERLKGTGKQKEQQKKKSKKFSPNTVKNLKAYLSCILGQAFDDEIIASNPASKTGKFIKKTDRKRDINPFTWEEKAIFEKVAQADFPRYYPLFLTLLRTGMRIGEAIALKPGDIDFNGNFIEVKRSSVRGRISTPKSGKGRRVDMSTGLATVLKAYLTKRKEEALKKGWGNPPELLFYNTAGNLIDINHLRKRSFYKALEKAGLRWIRLHDLRHTYATLRISKGDNIADVSKQLGHHSINITVDTYYHWIPGTGKSQVDELDGNGDYDEDEKANEIESV
jgi:integrase